MGFQSTLPVRGATLIRLTQLPVIEEFQSTLPVRGATRTLLFLCVNPCVFQSTLPVRGATGAKHYAELANKYISIHAPREGSDPSPGWCR